MNKILFDNKNHEQNFFYNLSIVNVCLIFLS